MSEQPKPPPGWYAHPQMVDTLRYWDGAAWTEQVAPGASGVAARQTKSTSETLSTAGWLSAFFVPIVGFIIGCVLLTKRPREAVGMMLLAIVMSVVWVRLLSGQSLL